MPWYGKIFGAIIGYHIFGPLGALLGFYFGHLIDQQETYGSMPRKPSQDPLFGKGPSLEEKHLAFFSCVFSMLAKLARVDGAISPDEIRAVEKFMREDLALDPSREKLAKNIFRAARMSPKTFEEHAEEFYKMFSRDSILLENILDTLLRISLADGSLTPGEENMLRSAARVFRLETADFERLRSRYGSGPDKHYQILGCTPRSSIEEIKSSYRRLVKENHPDAVRAQGQPEEFVKLSTEKFRAIQEAYDAIRQQRGIA